MKVAVTADCHLDERGGHPERYAALEEILSRLCEEDIGELIIAGDLFDRPLGRYSRFEALCRQYPDVFLHIIPGNHDVGTDSHQSPLGAKSLAIPNATVYDEVTVERIGGMAFLFVPYRSGMSMGRAVAEACDPPDGDWILVGHGDSSAASGVGNSYEEGTYMPLSSAEVDELSPSLTLLGHIHAPQDLAPLYYPGSPCGMNINETGPRSFLVLDTGSLDVQRIELETGPVFLRRDFLVLPEEEAEQRLLQEIGEVRAGWSADIPDLEKRARIRIRVFGYTPDRSGIVRCLEEGFGDLTFYEGESPDFSGLRESAGRQRSELARLVVRRIEEMDWPFGNGEPARGQVVRRALEMIYG